MKAERDVKQMFELGVEVAEQVLAKLHYLAARDTHELAGKGGMLFFFCKAYKSYQAPRVL